MRTIWKFPFEIVDDFEVEMPRDAEFLSAQLQGGVPTVWFSVEPAKAKVTRRFKIVGTGHGYPSQDLAFLATLQMPPFVWHLFEKIG